MSKILAAAAAAFVFTSAVATPAFAEGAAKPKINPWTDCGIGAAIFSENGTAAAISNIIWDLGTTAVSSQISSENSCSGKRVQTAMLINSTYASLETELASGEGKYLVAMADTMGCAEAVRPALVAEVRGRMASQVARPGFAVMDKPAKAEALFNIVDEAVSEKFAGQCSIA